MRKLILSLATVAGMFATAGAADAASRPSAGPVPSLAAAPAVQTVQYYPGYGRPYYARPQGYGRGYGYGPRPYGYAPRPYRYDSGYGRWQRHEERRWHHRHGW